MVSSENNNSVMENPTFMDHFNQFMSSVFVYGTIFVILTVNFVALSLSLHINYDKPTGKKVGSAIFAFMFGLIYIVFTYYLYYIVRMNKIRPLNSGRMFPWS